MSLTQLGISYKYAIIPERENKINESMQWGKWKNSV